jgi:hypothetical protein
MTDKMTTEGRKSKGLKLRAMKEHRICDGNSSHCGHATNRDNPMQVAVFAARTCSSRKSGSPR